MRLQQAGPCGSVLGRQSPGNNGKFFCDVERGETPRAGIAEGMNLLSGAAFVGRVTLSAGMTIRNHVRRRETAKGRSGRSDKRQDQRKARQQRK